VKPVVGLLARSTLTRRESGEERRAAGRSKRLDEQGGGVADRVRRAWGLQNPSRGNVNDEVPTQLRGVSAELKRLLAKNQQCACVCDECLAGDCVDCSDPDCTDENCEGSMLAQQQAEELAALKALAESLKSITT
jgi:hypothetical protein